MINSIIEAISAALNDEFGNICNIYMEDGGQDLQRPCFLISCQNSSCERFLGNRYARKSQFRIRYFPKTEEMQRECNSVAERMWRSLEYVRTDGEDRPIRGTKMRYEKKEGVLDFFVNYDGFVYRPKDQTPMDEMESSIKMKEGE